MMVCNACGVAQYQEHKNIPHHAWRWVERPPERPPLGAKPVWLRLEDAAGVSKAKDKEYGESYLSFGPFAAALFPNGLELKTAEDWGRFAILFEVIQKVHRYSLNFQKGGHADSLTDITVYAQMLARLDDLARPGRIVVKEEGER